MTVTATRRSRVRSALRLLSTLLIVSGSLLLADAGATLVLGGARLLALRPLQQGDLQDQLDRLDNISRRRSRRRRSRSCPTRSAGSRSRRLAGPQTHDGDAVGKT